MVGVVTAVVRRPAEEPGATARQDRPGTIPAPARRGTDGERAQRRQHGFQVFGLAAAPLPRPLEEPTKNVDGREQRSEEHTSELQSRLHLVCRLLLEKKKK